MNAHAARKMLAHELAPTSARNACKFLLAGIPEPDAIKAAAIVLKDDHSNTGYHSWDTRTLEDSITKILRNNGVI